MTRPIDWPRVAWIVVLLIADLAVWIVVVRQLRGA
jgi:hypothetical protein